MKLYYVVDYHDTDDHGDQKYISMRYISLYISKEKAQDDCDVDNRMFHAQHAQGYAESLKNAKKHQEEYEALVKAGLREPNTFLHRVYETPSDRYGVESVETED